MAAATRQRQAPYYLAFLIVVAVVITAALYQLYSRDLELVRLEGGVLTIQDFTYYLAVTEAFWHAGITEIYQPESQLEAISQFIGSEMTVGMPIGTTPTALLVWYPFVCLMTHSLELAVSVWTALSLAFLFSGILKTCMFSIGSNQKGQLAFFIVAVTVVFSFAGITAFLLGQTVLLVTGILSLLAVSLRRFEQTDQRIHWLIPVLCLFLLSMKPHYLIFCAMLLLLYGYWKETVAGVLATLLGWVLLTPKLGLHWIADYFQAIRVFTRPDIPGVYLNAFALDEFTIFRSAFRPWLGDNIAVAISQSTVLLCGILILGMTVTRLFRAPNHKDRVYPVALRMRLISILVATYLLFTPYAGGYEDTLTLFIVCAMTLAGVDFTRHLWRTVVLLLACLISLNHGWLPDNEPLWFYWAAKLLWLSMLILWKVPTFQEFGGGNVSQRVTEF
jgi:hypothetical protein